MVIQQRRRAFLTQYGQMGRQLSSSHSHQLLWLGAASRVSMWFVLERVKRKLKMDGVDGQRVLISAESLAILFRFFSKYILDCNDILSLFSSVLCVFFYILAGSANCKP